MQWRQSRFGPPDIDGVSCVVLFVSVRIFFNSALKSADLGGNDIGDEGVIAISEALKTNSTLTELGLGSSSRSTNKIGPAGAQALADMLQVSSALKVLDLADNDIGKAGAAALAAVLPKR